MALFTAGNVLTAAQLNALNGYVLKTADQSVTSSSTLTNDTHLLYTIGATGTYIVDLWLYGTSAANNAGDLKIAFTFPTGTMHFGTAGPSVNLLSGSADVSEWFANLSATSGTTFTNVGLSTTVSQTHIHGILIATATGTLRMQWAQFASNANASTLQAGSHMLVRQVA